MPDALKALRQVCFVDMPFGRKTSSTFLGEVDFHDIYFKAIKPAVEQVGLSCVRGDEEISGGIVHRTMFARLVHSEFLVADLTMGNPNVFYELGIRHAVRPRTTIPIFEAGSHLPFDVALVRSIPYRVTNGRLDTEAAGSLRHKLISRLSECVTEMTESDSPMFQLLPGYKPPTISSDLNQTIAKSLSQFSNIYRNLREARNAAARDNKVVRLREIETSLGDLRTIDANVIVELFNSYYFSAAYSEAFYLYDRMPAEAKELPTVKQRLAMALTRVGRLEEALDILDRLQTHGGDPKSIGMRGRILMQLYRRGDSLPYLERAADAFVTAFMIDPTDTYLGINALRALVKFDDSAHKQQFMRLLPVVYFAAERSRSMDSEDPWAVATLMELAALMGNGDEARRAAALLCSLKLESWMLLSIMSELEAHVTRETHEDKRSILTDVLASLAKAKDACGFVY